MINNARARPGPRPLLAVAAALAAAACDKSPTPPPGWQGIVEYDERVLAFEEAGRVASVPVHKGDRLNGGEVLAALDDTLERATRDARAADVAASRADLALLVAGSRAEDVAAAAADVSGAEASESLLQANAERAHRLFSEGAISRAEVDRADSDLEQARARHRSLDERLGALRRGARPQELARARALADERASALALEEQKLARHVLRAGDPGVVLDVHVKTGEFAAVGAPVVTIADTRHPYADVFVPEGALTGAQVGTRATLRVDAQSEPLGAVIEYVSPEAEFTPKFIFSERERPNLVIRVRVRVDDPGRRLHAGVPAFVQVQG